MVLLEALERDVLGVGHRRAGDRVEHLLLDRGMDRELLDDPVDDLALLDVGAVAGLLEALEQLLDGLVVGAEKGDGIHEPLYPHPSRLTRSRPVAHPATGAGADARSFSFGRGGGRETSQPITIPAMPAATRTIHSGASTSPMT